MRDEARYEILPFGAGLEEARRVPDPLVLTVTCSPRHGVDQMLGTAIAIAELGHRPVPHLATRMLRDRHHLDTVLRRMRTAGITDLFLIGGDAAEPLGAYRTAQAVLPYIDAHHLRPPRIGIAAYPEGHPLIDRPTLDHALLAKAAHADYAVTQMCFDPATLRRWVEETRAHEIDLPLYLGLPGVIDPRRLLEISMRIGVGGSLRFVRKQRGLRALLGQPTNAADRMYQAAETLVADAALAIHGPHFFTFNRLVATRAWHCRHAVPAHRRVGHG